MEKELKMIDDDLRNMEKMVDEKKDFLEEKIKKEMEVEQKQEKLVNERKDIVENKMKKEMEVEPKQETSTLSSQQPSGQSLEDFKSEQAKYEKFPTQPADTRR